jgi:hypothetical protein
VAPSQRPPARTATSECAYFDLGRWRPAGEQRSLACTLVRGPSCPHRRGANMPVVSTFPCHPVQLLQHMEHRYHHLLPQDFLQLPARPRRHPVPHYILCTMHQLGHVERLAGNTHLVPSLFGLGPRCPRLRAPSLVRAAAPQLRLPRIPIGVARWTCVVVVSATYPNWLFLQGCHSRFSTPEINYMHRVHTRRHCWTTIISHRKTTQWSVAKKSKSQVACN